MHYDIVSFDLDGTLVDTASEIAEAANRALESHGIARRPTSEVTALIGAGTHELMIKLLARVMIEQPHLADRVRPDQVLASMDEHYALTTGTSSVPYPGAREALRSLKAERVLRVHRLEGQFDLLIGGDSLPVKKPDPRVLRHVVEQLGGHVDRCGHVGDSRIDVEAARNAGVTAWAVPYGYNAGQPIEDARPARLFRSLDELAHFVIAGRSCAPDGSPASKHLSSSS
jgi:phosphoglycolate phosphatase